ncbi:MAG: Gfo/Idh/MocA family oxidoreductase [Anaerolineales bacterium]|nr:Gfo/Idh/MocA family oxidoreductase [Anaerolineales bacterium]
MKQNVKKKHSLKIGILGNGFMGRMRAHAYLTVAHIMDDLPFVPELVAVSGLDEKSLEAFTGDFNIGFYTKNWADIVDDESIDIINICLPENLHAEPAIRALEQGKHVFCEKALALDAASALEMTRAAEQSGKINMCGMNYRFLPAVQLARDLIHNGDLGNIYTMHACYFQESGHDPYRPVEEVLYAYGENALGSARGLGSHVIDTCRFLLGEMSVLNACFKTFVPERKTKSGDLYRVEVDDFASMTVEFETGAIGMLSTSKVAAGRKNWFRFEINGSKGSLEFNLQDLNTLRVFLPDRSPSQLSGFTDISVTEKAHPLMSPWWPPAHNLGWEHSHINEIHHFLYSIANNQDVGPSGATFHDGYRAVELVEQAESSSGFIKHPAL